MSASLVQFCVSLASVFHLKTHYEKASAEGITGEDRLRSLAHVIRGRRQGRRGDGQAVSRWRTLVLSMKCLLSIIGLLKLTAALEEVGYEDCIRFTFYLTNIKPPSWHSAHANPSTT